MTYDEIISYESLYKAAPKCFKNVRWKDSVVSYEHNLPKRIYKLKQELWYGEYKLSKYQVFEINEPKKRTIVATRLPDRIVQRSICDNTFYDDITRSFIKDNCACQKDRGIDYAIGRLTRHLRKFYIEHGTNGYVLKCDITHFFESIPHDVAKKVVDEKVKDPCIRDMIHTIIDSFGDKGLGLGSQMSQLIALAVLDKLDHYIKERLGIKFYIRYMDDFILIHNDRDYLKKCLHEINTKLTEIGLTLNVKKTRITSLNDGILFLKWRFRLTDSGKIIRKMSKDKLKRQRQKLKKIVRKERVHIYKPGTAEESLRSWLANAERGHTYHQRKRMIAYYRTQEKSNG